MTKLTGPASFLKAKAATLSAVGEVVKTVGKVGEFFIVTVWVDGKVAFEMIFSSLSAVGNLHIYPSIPPGKVKVTLSSKIYNLNGYHRSGTVRIPFTISPNRRDVEIVQTANGLHVHARKARARALTRKRVNSPTRMKRTSTKRPASEVQTTPFPNTYVDDYGFHNSGTDNVITYQRAFSGTVTPGFRWKKKSQLPINPYSLLLMNAKDSGYYTAQENPYGSGSVWTHNSYLYRHMGTWSGGPAVGSCDHDLTIRNRLIRKLSDKAGLDVNNVAQDFVQLDQTLKMVKTTCDRVTRAFTAVKKFDLPSAISALWGSKTPVYRRGGGVKLTGRSAADNWLELQYGWKPLLQDVKGAFASLATMVTQDGRVSSVSSSVHAQKSEINPLFLDFNVNGVRPKCGLWMQFTTTDIKIKCRYRVDDRMKAFLAQTGFTNPLNLAWEVIPYSFVVDWFLPIGAFLETLSSWDGLTFIDGLETRFTRQNTYGMADYNGADQHNPPWDYVIRGAFSVEKLRYDRICLSAFPSARLPSFKNPLGVVHAANALALMRSAFKH